MIGLFMLKVVFSSPGDMMRALLVISTHVLFNNMFREHGK